LKVIFLTGFQFFLCFWHLIICRMHKLLLQIV
jgi:hypothetical protein